MKRLPPDTAGPTFIEQDHLCREVLANASDLIITTDLNGLITVASASVKALLGHAPEALVGTPVHRLYPAGRETADHLMAAIMKDGGIGAMELKIKRRDDTLLDVSLSAALLKDDAGTPSGILGIFRDITELKALSQKVFQSERMAAVATLAGGIAHNFNNLLMSIQGYTALMLMDVSGKHRHFGMLRKIESQVAAGSRLTQKLMGFAREGEYTVRPVHLNHLLMEVSEAFLVSRSNILIEKDLDPGSPAVIGDRAQLEEVIQNLFTNAGDAMPAGGKITCRTRIRAHSDIEKRPYALKPGSYVQLTVSDTGCGIAPEHLPFIFEPFYSTKDVSQGAGLGLASVFGIVKAHGGFIEADGGNGKGAVFEILLPVHDAAAVAEMPARDRVHQGSETILVVDNDDVVLEVASKMLSALGYRTLTAATVSDALSIYSGTHAGIDMVLLDLGLEGTGAADVFEGIRARDADARMLIASSRSLDDAARSLLGAGACGFIRKPFGLRDLSSAVRKILDEK